MIRRHLNWTLGGEFDVILNSGSSAYLELICMLD
jgi:hypothetical protein